MLNMTPSELAEAARAGLERMEQASLDLAMQGWTLPMSLTPAETYEVLDTGSPDAVDALFVRLYEGHEGQHFERLAETLLDRNVLAQWRGLLKQTISAYRHSNFSITIPSLLLICEGVLMRGHGNRTDLRIVVCERAGTEQRKSRDSFDAILWCNIKGFIDELFKKSDFSTAPPDRLNRHWVLHGRDASRWSQADSLRLFQAVDTISTLIDDRAV